jgi:hypothetical protein
VSYVLQTKLGPDPTYPWVSSLRLDAINRWHCSLTKEDLEIFWRHGNKSDWSLTWAAYTFSDKMDYYIMRDMT